MINVGSGQRFRMGNLQVKTAEENSHMHVKMNKTQRMFLVFAKAYFHSVYGLPVN